MMYTLCLLFLLFLCYSIIGWMIECLCVTYLEKRIVLDRGFLLGPYCPIYGCGGVLAYLLLTRYQGDPITLFILAAVGASILEYVTSYFMEKIFKARWWDYSDRRFNLEGRVCLGNAVLFGALGLIFIYILNPYLIGVLKSIPKNILITISLISLCIFVADTIFTFIIMGKLRNRITHVRKDSTSEIDKQIKEFLSHYYFFVGRLFKVFPKIKISVPMGDKILKSMTSVLTKIEQANKRRKLRKKQKKEKKEIV